MKKEEYEKLKKESDKSAMLPSFDSVNDVFEIESIDESCFLLRGIRRKIADKFEGYARILEELLQPDTTFSNIHEIKNLTNDDKESIYKIYREMMALWREAREIAVYQDEEETIMYIMNSLNFWNKRKEEIKWIMKKVKDAWKEKQTLSEKQAYFG